MKMLRCDGCRGTRDTISPKNWVEIHVVLDFCEGCQTNAKTTDFEKFVRDAVSKAFDELLQSNATGESRGIPRTLDPVVLRQLLPQPGSGGDACLREEIIEEMLNSQNKD